MLSPYPLAWRNHYDSWYFISIIKYASTEGFLAIKSQTDKYLIALGFGQ